ncbi:MAG: hypothetical protein IKF51_07250 [Solobacterium sp.]|nr:hypothetical protein [Solobacterium sp.]
MPIIRITPKRPVREEYAAYPELVQIYHQYDIYAEDYLNKEDSEQSRIAAKNSYCQDLVLSRMNEEEFRELLRSCDGFIAQGKADIARRYRRIKEITSLMPEDE